MGWIRGVRWEICGMELSVLVVGFDQRLLGLAIRVELGSDGEVESMIR